MDRREFVVQAAGAGALLSVFPAGLSGLEREKGPGGLERRALGKTGEKLSVIGFGGVVVKDATTEQAAERVRTAVEAGVNYFDVAPSYGNAEDMLGPALEPYRKNVFLACKTQGTDEGGGDRRSSRARCGRCGPTTSTSTSTTRSRRRPTWRRSSAPAGPWRRSVTAKKAGKVRFFGFSAHSAEAATALMEGYAFDSILFPVNYAVWHAGGFGPQVLAKAKEKGMGILCLKAMAKGPWPEGATRHHPKCWYEPLATPEDAAMGLRFTLSHPVTAAIPPGDESLFALALKLAAAFQPLSDAEVEAIKAKGLAQAPLFRYPSQDA